MRQPMRVWDVECSTCRGRVGQIQGDRFYHDPDCTRPRQIANGTLRCCDCGGTLTRVERPAASEPDVRAPRFRVQGGRDFLEL